MQTFILRPVQYVGMTSAACFRSYNRSVQSIGEWGGGMHRWGYTRLFNEEEEEDHTMTAMMTHPSSNAPSSSRSGKARGHRESQGRATPPIVKKSILSTLSIYLQCQQSAHNQARNSESEGGHRAGHSHENSWETVPAINPSNYVPAVCCK